MAAASLNVQELLTTLGISATTTGGGKWNAVCPNPHHADTSPSWAIIDRPGHKKHGSHHCQSCKWGGGPWELAAAIWDCDLKEAGRRLRDIGVGKYERPKEAPKVRIVEPVPRSAPVHSFKLPIGSTIPAPGDRWFAPALKYLQDRGVSMEQIERHRIGFATRGLLVNRVIFPVYDIQDRLLTFTARGIVKDMTPRYEQGKARKGAKPRRAIWGEDCWDMKASPRLWIAEGTFSALALESAGARNVAALLGSELTEEKARVLDRWPEVVVATDPDKAGDAIAVKLSVLARRAQVHRMVLPASPDDVPREDLRRIVDQTKSLFV